MATSLKSVRDVSEFPFDTFEEFQEACGEGRVLVSVRYDFRAVWAISSRSERLMQIALTGSGFLVSLLLAGIALLRHDLWLLWGVPAALIGLMASSPSPGLISGGGCVAIPLFASGFVGATFVNRSLFWAGVAGFACWFLASAGKGVADVTIREAMMRSEQTFLSLYRRRAITKVAILEEAESNASVSRDDSVAAG